MIFAISGTGSQSGAALRDLMARMGHDSERAAMIYRAAPTSSSRTPSTPTSRASRAKTTMTRTGRPGSWSSQANGTLMARKINNGSLGAGVQMHQTGSDLGLSPWSG